MFIFLKSIARTLVLPPTGPLILAILGLVLMVKYRRLGRALVFIGLVSLFLLSMPWVGEALERLAERYPPLDPSRPVDAQAIVILAGGSVRNAPEYGGPATASETLERVVYGAFLAHRTSLPVLVSGSPKEAAAMRATLIRDFGITPRWVENASGDTFENARFSERLLDADHIRRIVLVTSGLHEWRAAHEFMAAGFDVVPAPVGNLPPDKRGFERFVPGMEGLQDSYRATYELMGEPVRELFSALHLRRQQPQS
jgi:uncharacterized SAM-binding protein YcdF (DUF218 family)